ncbi:acyl-CoA thioesterase [Jannaschia sp. Os4]|uniref:acyl-CoA thioesterase n=1 Tax=Jannaschia sp. Os4 TaxID=2807617 RepID=UPI0031B582EA
MADGFVHEIRVGWGDCDPARIAYTGHLPGFALRAIDAWWEWALEAPGGWYHMEIDRGFGTPFVAMRLDFRAPVTPRHPLLCHVRPTRLGTTSVSFRVDARQDGRTCFEGEFTCVFVEGGTLEKRTPPEDAAAAIRAHLP